MFIVNLLFSLDVRSSLLLLFYYILHISYCIYFMWFLTVMYILYSFYCNVLTVLFLLLHPTLLFFYCSTRTFFNYGLTIQTYPILRLRCTFVTPQDAEYSTFAKETYNSKVLLRNRTAVDPAWSITVCINLW